MIRKQEGWNIVLAGLWNRAIFSPEWVGDLLFPAQEIETLLSIRPHLPIIYRNSQVSVDVSSGRLVFRPRLLNDACLTAAEEMAHSVLNKLRDTPLMAVGINFAFVEESPGMNLIKLFDFGDNGRLGDEDYDIRERRIVRKMAHGDDTLNLTLMFDGQSVTAEFNYHTETTNNEAAQQAVRQRAKRLRDDAIVLLRQVYRLEISEEDNG